MTIAIYDDLVANENKITPEQYKKVLKWWKKHAKDLHISVYSTPWIKENPNDQ